MKIDKNKFNYYGFDHDAVAKRFEGEISYCGSFSLEKLSHPVAVYKAANPDREKGHKDYILLHVMDAPFTGAKVLLVQGMDILELESQKLQTGLYCKNCGDVIYSIHRHDFRECNCKKIAIDGGKDYLHVSGDAKDYQIVEIDLLSGEAVCSTQK